MFPLVLLFCGLMVRWPVASPHSRTMKGVACRAENVSSMFQHCTSHSDGVHDLDCFITYQPSTKCEWKPSKDSSRKTHTLVVQQDMGRGRNYCKRYDDIADLSADIVWYRKMDVAAEVYENSESANCTRAAFRGSPQSLVRCGPPLAVTFSRHKGSLRVNVSWTNRDKKYVKGNSVQYRAADGLSWSEEATCQSLERCSVKTLNASLTYHVQIGCLTDIKCPQCPRSRTHVVPAELTQQLKILTMDERESAGERGRRTILLSWTFSAPHSCDGFYVTVSKASGEKPQQGVNTTHTEVRLHLSYSAYRIVVRAFNNASVSPPLTVSIPQRLLLSDGETSEIYVSVHNASSFTVHWGAQLVRTYVCFSVEWTNTQKKKTTFVSFYEDVKNYRTFTGLAEPVEPYGRYQLSLHTRPNKNSCNLKSVNSSETTYGSVLFYFTEGVPISAPVNLSCYNITKTSAVLTWSSIPMEDLRGFLLGYVIYYSEYQHGANHSVRNVTVESKSNSSLLDHLKSGTVYHVQISGFTRTGIGVRSPSSRFETVQSDHYTVTTVLSFVGLMVAMAMFGLFGPPVVKRTKVLLWPSLPTPGQSLTIQKMQQRRLQEYPETVSAPAEESDSSSLQIIEEEEEVVSELLPHQEDEKKEDEDEDDDDGDEDSWTPEEEPGTSPGPSAAPSLPPALVFTSDYTTLEMFLRAPPAGALMAHKLEDS